MPSVWIAREGRPGRPRTYRVRYRLGGRESARLDGASELKILTRIAIPLAKPAILTAVIVTFIGPWNEFLWPFLVTKQLALQPLAVALANFISTVAARQANPFGAILAGAVVLAVPAVVLFLVRLVSGRRVV